LPLEKRRSHSAVVLEKPEIAVLVTMAIVGATRWVIVWRRLIRALTLPGHCSESARPRFCNVIPAHWPFCGHALGVMRVFPLRHGPVHTSGPRSVCWVELSWVALWWFTGPLWWSFLWHWCWWLILDVCGLL